MDLISILIPFKDTERFLTACLNSILAQTYPDWEVIAVNDDSSDNSRALVADYTSKDARIQLLDNEGAGIIPALRTAYMNSKGRYITRMDSDDIMKPKRLEYMINALRNHGKGHISVGQVHYFSDRGISDGYSRYERWLNDLTREGKNYDEIYKECVIPSPCWLIHRADFEESGAFEPNRYPEDYDLTFRFYEQQIKIIPCNEVLHLWRDYDTRTSRTHEHYAQNYFLEIKLHYFLKLDYENQRPLVVWGAGFKGKKIAKKLVEKQIEFLWLCDNPNKINKKIYGQRLHHFSKLEALKKPQSIITVANEDAQGEIKAYLTGLRHQTMMDYFFFC